MEYQPRGGFKDGDTWELNTANRKEGDGEGRTKICLGITGHLIRVSSILLPISVCTSASLPLPADPLPLSPQVRIWLCSLCGLGGRQPLHAGRVPPVLLLACQGTPRTAVPSADTALHSPGVCLSPNPALLLPSASLPSKKLPGPWHSHPAWTLNAPRDLSPPYLPCFSTIFSAETEVLIVPPPISIIVLLSQAGRHPQPCIAARPCLSVCLSVTGMLGGPCREAGAGAAGAQSQSHGGELHRSALYHSHPSPTCCFQEQEGRKASAWFSWDEVFISNSTSLTWGSSILTPHSWQRDLSGCSIALPHCYQEATIFKLLLIIIDSCLEAS